MGQIMTFFVVEDAIRNPAKFFHSPDEVVQARHLTRAEKIKVLTSWEADQTQLLVAEEENMTTRAPQGGAAENLRRIHDARESLQ